MKLGTTELILVIIVAGSATLGVIATALFVGRLTAKRAADINEVKSRNRVGRLAVFGALLLTVFFALFHALLTMPHQELLAKRNRTAAFHRAIMSGLDNYYSDYGEYPCPSKPDATMFSGGKRWYDSNAAGMLYQALCGDGTDRIAIQGPDKDQPSDGQVIGPELERVKVPDMPRELWRKTDAGYILIDGFGHPFQYTPPGPETVNKHFDLWSFGEAPPPAIMIDKATKQSAASERWIKNW